ncbi:MAG: XF1762 family protein [Flavonifractor plautii]
MREANRFIEKHHRHSGRVQGCKFCVALSDGLGVIHGVAVAGRPISRYLDDGRTAEVTRLCTDGTFNGCSFLYGCCARIAREMGFRKIITYTLAEESGASLRPPVGPARRDSGAAGAGMFRAVPGQRAGTPAPNECITRN